jgi:GntR family transcriptional repressor for pyruvate dehydrogenase complex
LERSLNHLEGVVTKESVEDPIWGPIVTDGIVPQVVDRLAVAIRLGTLQDGERLPSTRELATRFDISRTLVQEALAELAEQGLISIRRGRTGGAFVQGGSPGESTGLTDTSTWTDDEHVLQAALLIEGSIAAAVAARRREASLHPVASLHRDVATTAFSAEIPELARRAADALCAATENPQLVRIHREIRDELEEVLPSKELGLETRDRLVAAHQRLMTALVRGRPEPARRAAEAALLALHQRGR